MNPDNPNFRDGPGLSEQTSYRLSQEIYFKFRNLKDELDSIKSRVDDGPYMSDEDLEYWKNKFNDVACELVEIKKKTMHLWKKSMEQAKLEKTEIS